MSENESFWKIFDNVTRDQCLKSKVVQKFSKMAAPIYNGLPDVELMTLIGSLETGKVVTIFFSKKRPERRTLEIKPLRGQLVWIKAQGVRPEGSSKCLFFFASEDGAQKISV